MSSRQRLYLNLKKSITELFKTPAHYLKELTGKHSLFEKPYLGEDYQQMHLNLPVPTWKRPEGKGGGPLWPKEPGGSYWSQFIFQEGKCSTDQGEGECGELINLDAKIDTLCTGPHSGDLTYAWYATSSDPELAIIQPIEQHLFGASATIPIQLSEENTGTVTICVTAQIARGSFIKDIKFPVPLPWWDPKYDYRWRNLRYMLANVFPMEEHRLEAKSWDCGCVDIEVTCDPCDDSGIAWDQGTSAETIGWTDTCVIAITDSLGVGGPYTWAVSGTNFSLANEVTEGLANTLISTASCGLATITVTGCDGRVITGYVRCTSASSNWSAYSKICSYCEQNTFCVCYSELHPYKYRGILNCVSTTLGSCDFTCDGIWYWLYNETVECDRGPVGSSCGECRCYVPGSGCYWNIDMLYRSEWEC